MENYDDDQIDGWNKLPSADEMQAYLTWLGSLPNIEHKDTYFTKLRKIAEYYRLVDGKIREHHAKNPYNMFRAYSFEWQWVFTPIEASAWQCIRMFGGIPLYPQYPVGRYHLDFGAPMQRVGLELDGKQFHNEEKDFARDQELKTLGWKIYRITGREMEKVVPNPFEEAYNSEDEAMVAIEEYMCYSGEGVILSLKFIHFGEPAYIPTVDDHYDDTESFLGSMRARVQAVAEKSLSLHTTQH